MQYAQRVPRRLLAVAAGVSVAAVAAILLAAGGSATAASKARARATAGMAITSVPWGSVNGQAVRLYTLTSGHRMAVRITNYGGVVQSIWVPDRFGRVRDIALGFSNLQGYVTDFTNPPSGGSGDTYFGAIIGRYANRIANGKFTLNGTTYTLPQNNGTNTLHGGPNAYNTQVWQATPLRSAHSVALRLTYTDPSGKNGFPGQVTNVVTYTLTAGNALRIDYRATTTAPTVVNFTNHSYFNLAGEGSGAVFSQLLAINANRYTPINANLIPTGQLAPVAGTPLDFRTMKPIGRDIHSSFRQLVLAHGYDHNFVLNRHRNGLVLAAVAEDPVSGRVLRTYTTEPGVQLYTSNFLVGDLVGPSGHTYRQSDGFTLETQHFPNSPNQPSFPSTTLNPGQTFTSTTIYSFSIAPFGFRF